MAVIVLNVVIGLLLALGGIQEAVVRGVLGGERVPFLVGATGTFVSLLLVLSGIALWRGWRGARGLTLLACALAAAFHAFAALPPRYVGILALLLGSGYPVTVMAHLLLGARREARAS